MAEYQINARYSNLNKTGQTLKICGFFLKILAFLILIGGMVCCISIDDTHNYSGVMNPWSGIGATIMFIWTICSALGSFLSGIFMCGAGESCIALADIATNSFINKEKQNV